MYKELSNKTILQLFTILYVDY